MQVCESLGQKIQIPEVFLTKKKKYESRKSPIPYFTSNYIYLGLDSLDLYLEMFVIQYFSQLTALTFNI